MVRWSIHANQEGIPPIRDHRLTHNPLAFGRLLPESLFPRRSIRCQKVLQPNCLSARNL